MSELTLDYRVGSGDLEAPLRALNIPVAVGTLPFGDAQIVGRGEDDRPVLVGVEIKRVGDLLQSLVDKRFTGHQLPGLLKGYEHSWLLVEGVWNPNREGNLVIFDTKTKTWKQPPWGDRPWKYESLVGWLNSFAMRTKLRIAFSGDRTGTAAWLAAQWKWWGAAWESHDSHIAMYTKDLVDENPLVEFEATSKMYVANAILRNRGGGIGIRKAKAASSRFDSIKTMINAPREEWEQIEGIGEVLAAKMVAEIERKEF